MASFNLTTIKTTQLTLTLNNVKYTHHLDLTNSLIMTNLKSTTIKINQLLSSLNEV